MKTSVIFLLSILTLLSSQTTGKSFEIAQSITELQAKELEKLHKQRKMQKWKTEFGSIDKELNSVELRYAIDILSNTVTTIGPKTVNKTIRYSGNSLNCVSCHLKGPSGLPGTKKFGIPFSNVLNDYPSFRARSMKIGSVEDRINGCMYRSQGNGKALPSNSREMKALMSYFVFLSKGTNKKQSMHGTGLVNPNLPKRKANVTNGKGLYNQFCISCHQVNGKGLKSDSYTKDATYLFPPLAGKDSFNDGAGMSRLIKATRFIYTNMPLGATNEMPILSVEQAYDIAAYIVSLDRPRKPHREKDFPNKNFRPKDYPVAEYFLGSHKKIDKAKYGPYE